MLNENIATEDDLYCGTKEDSSQQFLTFNIIGEECGIGLMSVREIKDSSKITMLSNSSGFMKGFINLRGMVIPVFDLRKCLGVGDAEPIEKHTVIILAIGKRLIGILVDSVSDILNASNEDIQPTPKVASKIGTTFINGFMETEEKNVLLLNLENLFDIDMIAAADSLSATYGNILKNALQ